MILYKKSLFVLAIVSTLTPSPAFCINHKAILKFVKAPCISQTDNRSSLKFLLNVYLREVNSRYKLEHLCDKSARSLTINIIVVTNRLCTQTTYKKKNVLYHHRQQRPILQCQQLRHSVTIIYRQ